MTFANRISFNPAEPVFEDDTLLRAFLPTGWLVTVVDGMTGFGYRDVETGLRCLGTGRFWLASGRFDIRDHLHEVSTEDELVEMIQRNANTYRGEDSGRYPHRTHEQLMRYFGDDTGMTKNA
jgi:hypothetical protein